LSWSKRKAYTHCQFSTLYFSRRNAKKTYHNTHSSNLTNHHNSQKTHTHLPPIIPITPSPQQDNRKSHKSCQFQNNREVHQETHASPHGAKVSVFAMAVFRDGERRAARGERGTATV
jgi:hypothetical protein